ncbi:MAG: transcriptional repressor LexA [Pseudobdellovibrionaceae bacterium]
MLTKKQRDLLLFIQERMGSDGVAPSFDEMKDALDLKSKSGVHRLITGLVERGYLRRLPNRARALEVIRQPDEQKTAASAPAAAANANSQSVHAQLFQTETGVRHIPFFGKIAAGTPIEAIRHEGDYFDAPLSMLGKGDFYALTVDGDSMKQAGINNGDTAIIRRTEQAHNGDIIVALVRGEEVTLKTLRKSGGQILLCPENDDYEVQTYDSTEVAVQGVLASIIRNY